MRAARFSRFGGPEVLEIVEVPEPHPGPGEVRVAVRAAGVGASDWKKRQGTMDPELPQLLGHSAAGVVDEVGPGVTGVAVGDRVFGLTAESGAQAEYAVLSVVEPLPASLTMAQAAALPAPLGTAARALDQLGVTAGTTLFVSGASGSVGSAALQLAVARGARVIGSGSPAHQDYLRSLGAEPTTYGDGLVDRVRAIAPDGVDVALDVAGSGVLPELIELTGDADHVVTLADVAGAAAHGVLFSTGENGGHAFYVLGQIGDLIAAGRFRPPEVRTFPLADIAEVHRIGEREGGGGKLVLTVGPPPE